ncbi:SMI1/KNR4 family protein [Cronobacter dublinensis]|nr:SMI1/KNR4 family protein [Cronobacter dublinensis]
MAIFTGTGIGETDIDNLGRKFSVTFPDDYSDFLKKYNGFRVKSPDYCNIPFNKVDNAFISFDVLFGHGVSNKYFDISTMNDELLDELSFVEHAVIIGADPGGNYYVLITEGGQSGVFYWDRTCLHLEDVKQDYSIADEDEEETQHLYLVASTFQQFFDILAAQTIQQGMSVSQRL